MTPTPMSSLSSRRTGLPQWIWRALLIVAALQCAAVLLATVAHIAGWVSEPATTLDGIVAAMAVCVVLLAVLLYRHYAPSTAETSPEDKRDDALMAAQLAPDLAPQAPMTWQPVPHLAHDALAPCAPVSQSMPLPLSPDVLKSA